MRTIPKHKALETVIATQSLGQNRIDIMRLLHKAYGRFYALPFESLKNRLNYLAVKQSPKIQIALCFYLNKLAIIAQPDDN